MNSREVALVSAATIFGALASTLAIRFFFTNPKNYFSGKHSSQNGQNGVLSTKTAHSQSPFDPSKRRGYLSWDDYFMAIAFLSAERSKDPNRQVGACLVSQNGVILGKIIWCRWEYAVALAIMGSQEAVQMTSSLGQSYVCHAEVNAILNTNHASAAGQRLYVTMFPCNECAKIIIQSGVSEVIYFVEKRLNNSQVAYIASHKLLSMAGVKVRKHQPQMDQILIKFEEL
ncbi:putative deoxycytidylate deaminase [Vitis vinifera]|uniref:dCMP deaminase n=1 Tax=Vitis vinifera TaxID=29760 RepID=A0A438K9I4_VITVI|nr:putative deoxycytidylate deaminase [Vitis vinifera]